MIELPIFIVVGAIVGGMSAWLIWGLLANADRAGTEEPSQESPLSKIAEVTNPFAEGTMEGEWRRYTFRLPRERGSELRLGECPGRNCLFFRLEEISVEQDMFLQHFTIGGGGLFTTEFGRDGRNAFSANTYISIAGGGLRGNPFGDIRTGVIQLDRDSRIQICGEVYDAQLMFASIEADNLTIALLVKQGTYSAPEGARCAWMPVPPLGGRRSARPTVEEPPKDPPKTPPRAPSQSAPDTDKTAGTTVAPLSPQSSDKCGDVMFDLENIGGDVVIEGNTSYGIDKMGCVKGETKTLTVEDNVAISRNPTQEELEAIIKEATKRQQEDNKADKETATQTPDDASTQK